MYLPYKSTPFSGSNRLVEIFQLIQRRGITKKIIFNNQLRHQQILSDGAIYENFYYPLSRINSILLFYEQILICHII